MCDSNDQQYIILKEARDNQSFNVETNVLDEYFLDHRFFRQLVNLISNQKIMMYEYLSDNLHNVLYTRSQRKLEEEKIKRLIWVVLKSLMTMHKKSIAHNHMFWNKISSRVLSLLWLY